MEAGSYQNIQSKGFVNHFKMLMAANASAYTGIDHYQKNRKERVGDKMLWLCIEAPKYINKTLHDPAFLVCAGTATAMILNTFLFYPAKSLEIAKNVINLIQPPAWTIRLTGYIVTMNAIAGWGMRSLGRVTNQDLMDHWYQVGLQQ